MRLVKELAELVEEMMNVNDFTSYEAFLAIDNNNYKYVEYTSLSDFLAKHDYNISSDEARAIIYRLDLDNDQRISYDEFQQIFFPINYYGGVVRSELSPRREEKLSYRHEEVYTGETSFNQSQQNFAESGNNFNRSQDEFKGTGFSSNTYQRSPRPKVSTSTSFYRTKNVPSSVSPRRLPLQYDYSMSPRQPLRQTLSSSRRRFSPERETRFAKKTLYSPYRVNLTKSPERQRYISPNRINTLSPITSSRQFSPRSLSYRQEDNNTQKNKANSAILSKYLYEILSFDINVESLKEALSVKSDINIRDLFNYFDLTGRGYISLVDMKEVLKELDIFAGLDDIKLLYKRFDKDLDGRFE
jgi:Ca2+-binding EF-hand superfamily protein